MTTEEQAAVDQSNAVDAALRALRGSDPELFEQLRRVQFEQQAFALGL